MNRYYSAIIGCIFVHFLCLSQLRFTVWPEIISLPYLILHGYRYYFDVIHPQMPVLPYILAGFFGITGEFVFTLKIFTWGIIILTDILLWLVASKLFNKKIALVALVVYIPWQIFFEGNGLWFELAVTPILLISYYMVALWFINGFKKYLIIAGMLLGTAIFIKLSVIWIVLALTICLTVKKRKNTFRWLFPLIHGLILPVIAMFFFYIFTGQLANFLTWAFIYPLGSMIRMPGYIELPTLRNIFVILLSFIPIVFFLTKKKNNHLFLAFIFFLAALFFSLHRFAYFHFQPALPFFALLIADVFLSTHGILAKIMLIFYFVVVTTMQIKFVVREWLLPDRFVEPEFMNQVQKIKNLIPEKTTVFMYNVPSHYFVMANILPSKPWADTFPWYLEIPGIQEKIIHGLENQNVKFALYAPFEEGGVYELGRYKPAMIDDYVWKTFKLKEKVDTNLWILERI